MGNAYLWVKAFHIVFVASWFAGLFYLPRLFVNLAMVAPDSHAERARLLLMARKLYRFAGILMLPAVLLGLILWLYYGVGLGHGCGRTLRRFEQGTNTRSERWFRVFNESSVLMFAAIVVLVVVKPF